MELLPYLSMVLKFRDKSAAIRITDMNTVKELGTNEWPIPSQNRMAILGAGLGGSAAVFSRIVNKNGEKVFGDIVGFEIDSRVAGKAMQNIRQFKMRNVVIKCADFMREDISGFNIFYFNYPVIGIEFPGLMAPVLDRVRSGSVIFVADNPFIHDLFLKGGYHVAHRPEMMIGQSSFWTFIKI